MKKIRLLMIFFVVVVFGIFFTKNIMAYETDEVNSVNSINSAVNIPDAEIPSYPTDDDGNTFKFADATVGDIFSAILPYIYVISGLILLFMLIAGGLGLMTAAGDPKKMEASQGRITAALIGFLIVFISYFVVQLVEVMLNVDLLGGGGRSVLTSPFDGYVVGTKLWLYRVVLVQNLAIKCR